MTAHAEWKSLVCEVTSEYSRCQFLTIQFDEILQQVIAGNNEPVDANITPNIISYMLKDVATQIDRTSGVMVSKRNNTTVLLRCNLAKPRF
jgi:hypothetical protein